MSNQSAGAWAQSEANARGCTGQHGILTRLTACVAAYLYGSLPFVHLLARQRHVDLHAHGSGNVGGANLWAATGFVRGAAGWALDASKGYLPVALCRRLGLPVRTAELAGVCGMAGQCWPIFLGFNGGRGVSAFVGAGYAIDRRAWAASLTPMIAGSLWRIAYKRGSSLKETRSKAVPLGCFVAVIVFALTRAALSEEQESAIPAAALGTLLLLRRLTAPQPDDATNGPRLRFSALLYRLLYDRNTSD